MTLEDVYDDVLEIISRLGARIAGDVQPFLTDEISKLPGNRVDVVKLIMNLAPQWFRSISAIPHWIQDANWPVLRGKPMVFLGQINLPLVEGLFHDDAAAFVFISPEIGITETIIQVA